MEKNEIRQYNTDLFEKIKHHDEEGREYWFARELMPVFEYVEWRKFERPIKEAKIACKNSLHDINDHFGGAAKMVEIGSGTKRKILDYKLSRYACYLVVLNCDPRKEVISLAKTYFAVQTRKQELSESEYDSLSEDDKRLYKRSLTKLGNYSLNIAARNAGVKYFDKFHNAGYKGLYNGETADDIAKRKGLRYREDILDNMGSVELSANLFRIDLTEQKLKNENIKGNGDANKVHYDVGKSVRDIIIKHSGTLPENLPTPKKSLKEIEKERISKFIDTKL